MKPPIKARLLSQAMNLMFIAAPIFLILGIFWPLITIETQVGWRFITLIRHANTVSLFSTLTGLLQANSLFLFAIILFFSVLFPIAKLVLSYKLWYSRNLDNKHREKYAHLLAVTGKWSMLDVMVVGLLVVVLKVGEMVSVSVHLGIVFFAISVLLSMVISTVLSRVLPAKAHT